DAIGVPMLCLGFSRVLSRSPGAPAGPPAGARPAYGRPGPPSPGPWEARPPVAPAEPPRPTPGGFAPPQ
ncbi:hypothetical protein MTP10_06850, partial [Nonomuraea sp. 3-1Str]|nr:hypothetical protein [Nonomuraea sp. 3-1Str]